MYYLALIVPVILFFIPQLSDRKKLFIVSIPLIVIAIIRVGVGTDYFSYEFIYNTLDVSSFGSMLNNQARIEVGFRIIMYLFKSLNLPYQVFVGAISTLITVLIIRWVDENSENRIFSLTLFIGMFFLVWSLSALRQGIVLSIGTYLFLNKKVNIRPKKSIMIILLLTTIHYSALFYLLIIFYNKFNVVLTKRKLCYIVAAAIVTTFIPWHIVLPPFVGLPGMYKIVSTLNGKIGFFRFSSVVRLIFTVILLLHYDLLTSNKFNKKITDIAILGFAFYFLISMSELFAGRMTIFTFILVLLLFPIILNHYYNLNFFAVKPLVLFGLTIFVTLFLWKDTRAYHEQVAYSGNKNILETHTIFNRPDYNDYFDRYAFLTTIEKDSIAFRNEFLEENEERLLDDVPKEEILIPVREPVSGGYGVINIQGKWRILPDYNQPIVLNGYVMRSYDSETPFRANTISNLSNKILNNDELISIENSFVSSNFQVMNAKYEVVDVKFEDLSEANRSVIPFPDEVTQTRTARIEVPYTYYLMEIEYMDYYFFLYLDENLELFHPTLATASNRIPSDGVMRQQTKAGMKYITKEGVVIWHD